MGVETSTGSATIMAYIVDAIIVIFAVIVTIRCAKRGFVNCIFGFLSTILAITLAFSFAGFAVNVTGGLFGLSDVLTNGFTETFSRLEGFDVVIEENMDVAELLDAQSMSKIFAQLIGQNLEGAVGRTLGELVGETFGNYAILVISGVALFIVLKLLFRILKKFFNFVAKDGLLGGINKILGAAIGFIEALLIASFVVVILEMFPGAMEFLNSSIILTWIHNNNPLLLLLSLFLFL